MGMSTFPKSGMRDGPGAAPGVTEEETDGPEPQEPETPASEPDRPAAPHSLTSLRALFPRALADAAPPEGDVVK